MRKSIDKITNSLTRFLIDEYLTNSCINELIKELEDAINSKYTMKGDWIVIDNDVTYKIFDQKVKLINAKNVFEEYIFEVQMLATLMGKKTSKQSRSIQNAENRFKNNETFINSRSDRKLWVLLKSQSTLDQLEKHKGFYFMPFRYYL